MIRTFVILAALLFSLTASASCQDTGKCQGEQPKQIPLQEIDLSKFVLKDDGKAIQGEKCDVKKCGYCVPKGQERQPACAPNDAKIKADPSYKNLDAL
jgi:hypothetical protein